tara:strand:- start:41516 stop:42193 length:678 start_codon:yes stop_codon:yes gene_type:complete
MKQHLNFYSFNRKSIVITILFCLLLSSLNTYSQEIDTSGEYKNGNLPEKEDINPLRIGVKVGIPSFFTINVEYVTPLLDNRVAFAIDYFPLRINALDIEAKFKNFEIGSNIYLKNNGKGLYGGLSYYAFNAEATNIQDTDFDDGSFGTGKATIEFNTFNLKLGAKLGRAFYFRIELGYGFGNIPETIVITSTDGNSSTTEDIEEVISFLGAGVPIFNFGIGYSFL